MNNKILITQRTNIKESFMILNKTAKKTLVVIDKNKNLLGTLSSGDIRKAMLKGKKLTSEIKEIYKKKCLKFFENKVPSAKKIKKYFLNLGIDLIPIINKNGKVVNVIFPNSILKAKINKHEKKKFLFSNHGRRPRNQTATFYSYFAKTANTN